MRLLKLQVDPMKIHARPYMTSYLTGDIRHMQKRLLKLAVKIETKKSDRHAASSVAEIEQVALQNLTAADRDLVNAIATEALENREEYWEVWSRWEAALSAASWAAGVPYLTASERKWL